MITLIRSVLFLICIVEVGYAIEGEKCTSNADCANSEYCFASQLCPGNKVTGKCKAKPKTCTMDYELVTGCDGFEYANACVAAANGQSVKVKRKRRSRHNKTRYQRRHQGDNE